jgi:hypothetical protein
MVGARALADLCEQLEAAGRAVDWPTIGALVPRLDGLMDEVQASAEAFLGVPES